MLVFVACITQSEILLYLFSKLYNYKIYFLLLMSSKIFIEKEKTLDITIL